jgi:hypothetical protein
MNLEKLDGTGYAPIPRIFLENYCTLGMSMEEAMLVLHILDHTWGNIHIFPTAEHLAKVTGKSAQTIRMYLRSLGFKGYLVAKKVNGKKSYDWTPLMDALSNLNIPRAIEPVSSLPVAEEGSDPLRALLEVASELATDRSKKRKPINKSASFYAKVQKFEEKSSDQYNAPDMEFVLAKAWMSKGWKTPPPRFFGRDLKLTKDLIKIYSASSVAEIYQKSVEEWEKLQTLFNIKGFPSVAVFWGFKNSIFPYFIDGEGSINAQKGSGSQFDQTATKDTGEEIGW